MDVTAVAQDGTENTVMLAILGTVPLVMDVTAVAQDGTENTVILASY
jgi:hypothetical protein